MNRDIEMFFVEHEWNLEKALLAIAPSFNHGHTPSVEEIKEIDAGLEKLGVGIDNAVGRWVAEAGVLLHEKKAEYERWVAAKVFAGTDQERQVIAAKLRGLEAEMVELKEDVTPMVLHEQAVVYFRTLVQDAIKASDPGILSNKLQQAYSQIVLQFQHERAGRRMRSCVIPDQTAFVLNPNSLPRRAIGSPSVPRLPTGRTLYTSGCPRSTPAPGRPTSHWTNCRR